MRDIIAGVAGFILLVLFIGLLVVGGNAFGLLNLQVLGPRYEAANRRIVQQSIRREEGVSGGIASLCLNMRTAKGDDRKAFADLIVVQAEAQGGTITEPAQRCVGEAHSALNGL